MKRISLLFMTIAFIFMGCSNDDDQTKEQESQQLDQMHQEIIALSLVTTEACTNSEEWSFTAIGSKSCGGPTGYIAYSLKIDTVAFLKKVEDYTKAQNEFNIKWGIPSTCEMAIPPTGVDCVDGKPTLVYN
ncbi:hypothetical protein D3C72_306340 [compost metagenome]